MTDIIGIFLSSLTPLTLIDAAIAFGIFAILALSLNLEFGFCGVPNFGKVFFMGIASFLTGATVAHIINWIGTASFEICEPDAIQARINLSLQSPWLLPELFVLSLVLSAIATGAFGYLLSYPALRLREDYLGILLIASGELLRVFVRGLPQSWIACQSDALSGILKPSQVLQNYQGTFSPPFDWITPSVLVDGIFAIVILLLTAGCYFLVSRLTNSPYGRLLKSIRDDEPAAVALGKDPAKARAQVMIIGSAIAGIGGALFTYQLGSIDSATFITLRTFIVWAIVLLGGVANNRGVIVGAIVYTGINLFTFIGNGIAVQVIPAYAAITTHAPLYSYFQNLIVALLVIIVIMFRPQGILPEKPIKTPAWKVLEHDRNSDDKKPS